MTDDPSRGTAILLRFRRVVYEHTFVAVPVVGDMVKNGTLDFEALVVAGTQLARSSKWAPDDEPLPEPLVEPHPIQKPLPEGWEF